MQVKTKFLLFIVGISFFGIILIGVVAYNSAVKSDFHNELELVGELTEHTAVMLKGKKDLGEIQNVVGAFNNSRYSIYVIDSRQNIYPSDNNNSIYNRIFIELIKGVLYSDERSGYLENVDVESGGTKVQISFVWHITDLQGSPYSLVMFRNCGEGEDFEEFLAAFGMPLMTSGLVILWIAVWGALILAALFNRLEKQAHDLEKARDSAQQASKAKGEFLANMSHEIRTPLTAIIGFSETLLHHEQSRKDEGEYIKTIHRTGKHVLCLINEILDLSKIEASKLEIEHINFSPLKLLSDIEMVASSQSVDKDITFDVHYDFPLPAEINSDPFRLKQILYNLCSNAVKFTEHGYVGLNISCDASAQLMYFEVVDTGIGIKEENIERVFQSFSQADMSISRKYGGTGLGLTLSKELAEMLGGTITVESKIGVGSRFLLSIGTGALDKVEYIDSIGQLPEIDANTSIEIPDLSGRVLVAEDNEDNQRLISLLIRRTGVEVIMASNGEEAVEKALNNPVDLIFMDMQMPVMDGIDATRILREKKFGKPIIALTANAMKEDRIRCYSAGCTGFLSKPVDFRGLYDVLLEHLGNAAEEYIARKSETKIDNNDSAPIVSKLSGDPDFEDIVEIFIENLRKRQMDIQNALKNKDWVELDSLCHQLKGSGGGIGFPIISEVAGEIGRYIKDYAYDLAQSEIEKFNLICDRVYAGVDSSGLEKRT